jgi:hypothetical protein
MNPAINILQQPFVQVALPIIVALTVAAWLQNKRFDDIRGDVNQFRDDMRQFRGEVNQRLDRIEAKLDNHNERIARIEERTALVR